MDSIIKFSARLPKIKAGHYWEVHANGVDIFEIKKCCKGLWHIFQKDLMIETCGTLKACKQSLETKYFRI
jgi:hypothetical protein